MSLDLLPMLEQLARAEQAALRCENYEGRDVLSRHPSVAIAQLVLLERLAIATERLAAAHEAANELMRPSSAALSALALAQLPAVDDGRDDCEET